MKTLREETVGKCTLRVVQKGNQIVGLIVSGGAKRNQIEGSSVNEVWTRLLEEVGKTSPTYFGYDGARNRFLSWFNLGFRTPDYIKRERGYKVGAKSKLDEGAPLEAALTGSGFGKTVLSVYQQTNMLSQFETMRIRDLLLSPQADDFVRAAARFTINPDESALLDMTRAAKPHNAAKWTVLTYLPFLWRPREHMFLKPKVTAGFAERVGHSFARDYAPALNIKVYESLLDLASGTEAELADLQPADKIDVQSFIWVVGYYKEGSGSRPTK